jgi:hypothetical protein
MNKHAASELFHPAADVRPTCFVLVQFTLPAIPTFDEALHLHNAEAVSF